jgi:hypothetical protein
MVSEATLMRRTNRHVQLPQVEALEALTLLAGIPGTSASALEARHLTAIHEQLQKASTLVLRGTIQGTYQRSFGIPDTGTPYTFQATGRITPLGQSAVTAQVRTTGFIANGMATGSMSIMAPHGTVNLALTGPTQPGFASLPSKMSYQIKGGTGPYRHAQGSGSIAITIVPDSPGGNSGQLTLAFSRG